MTIHAVATVLVVTAGLTIGLTQMEWIAITAAIAIVWLTEAINTAIEMLCNLVCDNQYHPVVKVIKDISAGAVLIAAVASAVTALLVFLK